MFFALQNWCRTSMVCLLFSFIILCEPELKNMSAALPASEAVAPTKASKSIFRFGYAATVMQELSMWGHYKRNNVNAKDERKYRIIRATLNNLIYYIEAMLYNIVENIL